MGIELLVLDFDGTLTNAEKEAIPAIEGWKTDMARVLRLETSQLEERWVNIEHKINANPYQYGWKVNGIIVAPAYADPLVMATTISGILFDEEELYLNPQERSDFLQRQIFAPNYTKSTMIFKEDAEKFLRLIQREFDVCVVTNSSTAKVTEKVHYLGFDSIPVYGDAKKYIVNPAFEEVPESVDIGLGRPCFVRRQLYWNILSNIMQERSLVPEQVAVMGDIYELDLLLPQHKGMCVILTPNSDKAHFEIEAVEKIGVEKPTKGCVALNLDHALAYLPCLR